MFYSGGRHVMANSAYAPLNYKNKEYERYHSRYCNHLLPLWK